ncbi:MAG: hypothetical protein ACR2OZ_04265 [Verrucomicrobiales bacterium]
MKSLHYLLSSSALLAATLTPSFAQTATTKPVGYRTETLANGFNLLAADLAEKIEAAGTLDAGTAGATAVDNDVDFTSLGTADLLLKITNGADAGVLYQANQSGQHSLTVANPSGALVVGATYELRKSHTVSSLFGATNSAGLTAGGDETTADSIYVPSGPGAFDIIFYSDGSGFIPVGWHDVNGLDQANREIPYTTAFFIRNTGASQDVVFVGHVITTSTKVTVTQNFNYVSRVLPVGMTLDVSNLKDDLAQGGDETTADNVYIPTGPGAYRICFYSDGTGFLPVGWHDVNGALAGTQVLTSGFLIRRISATAQSVDLIIPPGLDI